MRGRERPLVRALVALALVSIAGLVAGAPAQAETQIASYDTAGCPSAPLWSIRYDLYWIDNAGHQTDRMQLPGVLDATKLFVDDVGVDSACGIRLRVDVFDEGDALWAANPTPATPARPADLDAALAAGYDSEFIRLPARGDEVYAGITTQAQNWAAGSVSEFPVDANGSQLPGYPGEVDPWALLQMHEWLHQVVPFYEPALGWPSNDVHGACEHGYIDATKGVCSQVDEHYFSDMLQGKVAEAAGPRGISAADFAKDGTPAHPLRAVLGAPLLVLPHPGVVRLSFPSTTYDGSIAVTAADAAGIVVATGVTSGAAPSYDWTLPARAGTYALCWVEPATAHYRPGKACRQPTVRRAIGAVALPVVRVSARKAPGSYKLQVSYRVTLQSVLDDDATPASAPQWPNTIAHLLLRRNGHTLVTHRLLLKHDAATVSFDVKLPRSLRNVSLQLRPPAAPGSFAAPQARTLALSTTKT